MSTATIPECNPGGEVAVSLEAMQAAVKAVEGTTPTDKVLDIAEAAADQAKMVLLAGAIAAGAGVANAQPAAAHEGGAGTVVVEPGSSLSEIAADQDVTVRALAKANGLKNIHKIQAGSTLTVPSGDNACAPGQERAIPGDTVTSISNRKAIASGDFLAQNQDVANHPRQWVFEGRCYNVNVGGGEKAEHIVADGDTVYGIASGKPELIQAIVDVNGLTMWKDGTVIIRPGQKLIIPGVEPTVTPNEHWTSQSEELMRNGISSTVVLPEGKYMSHLAHAINKVTGIDSQAVLGAIVSAHGDEDFQLNEQLQVPGITQEIVDQAVALLNPKPAEISVQTLETVVAPGLPPETIPKIEAMKPGALALEHIYRQAEEATGVPWEILAAIHYLEANNDPGRDLQAGNPLVTGGSQYSSRGAQPNLLTSVINAGNDLQHSAVEHSRFAKRIDRNNLDLELLKDVLFSHNGRSPQYARQAADYGYDPEVAPYEGSPYVVEGLTPDQQDMGMITRDHGRIDGNAKRPGAIAVAIGLGLLDGLANPAPEAPEEPAEPAPETVADIANEAVGTVAEIANTVSERIAADPRLEHRLINPDQEVRKESNGVETVEVKGIRIRVEAAPNLARLLEHAEADGFNLTSSPRGAHRSPEQQIELFIEGGCEDGQCDGAPVAKPGTSNHESHPDNPLSYAVDFRNNGQPITSWTDPAAQWLKQNGPAYGFFGEISSEPWHWSGTGK